MNLLGKLFGKTALLSMALEAYKSFNQNNADTGTARALADQTTRFEKIENSLCVLQWMVGVALIGILVIAIKLFN